MIKFVVFDLAGTRVDHGTRTPMRDSDANPPDWIEALI